jgi:hypothetical protein
VNPLERFLADELDRAALPEVAAVGRALADRLQGQAVLFYGSVLRTGDLDGLLDFYVLRDTAVGEGFVERYLWPNVSYHEIDVGGRLIRAKVALMALDTFSLAARGDTLDTTIWARFVQPCALIWAANGRYRVGVLRAVASAAMTAGRFAALHGPRCGTAASYWRALFRATYSAELRVEAPGREELILAHDVDRYDALLPLAWDAAGIPYARSRESLSPSIGERPAAVLASAWLRCEQAGRALNLARLCKAAFTFDGAARYAAWKIERHTGLRIAMTPFRERHPIIAAPGVLWRLWRHVPS